MSEKNKNKIVTILFSIIIILSFFINIIKKDEIISIAERRKLEQFPSVSISQIINMFIKVGVDGILTAFSKFTYDLHVIWHLWAIASWVSLYSFLLDSKISLNTVFIICWLFLFITKNTSLQYTTDGLYQNFIYFETKCDSWNANPKIFLNFLYQTLLCIE